MNTIVENATGMQALTDQVIAEDLLTGAKSAVKSYAAAITEAASPSVRTVLKSQLEQAIMAHEQITNFMMDRGWYKAYQMQEQIQANINNANTAIQTVGNQQTM